MTLAMRSRTLMISRAMIAMSVAWPPAPPLGWWIRKRVCGRQKRRSLGTDRNRCVAALPTQPVPIMRTGAPMKRMTSCTVAPASRWPRGVESDEAAHGIGRARVVDRAEHEDGARRERLLFQERAAGFEGRRRLRG